MKERECFKCGKILDFDSYIKNVNPRDRENLTEIWESDYIEFYCCHCYSFKIRYQPYDDVDDFSYY